MTIQVRVKIYESGGTIYTDEDDQYAILLHAKDDDGEWADDSKPLINNTFDDSLLKYDSNTEEWAIDIDTSDVNFLSSRSDMYFIKTGTDDNYNVPDNWDTIEGWDPKEINTVFLSAEKKTAIQNADLNNIVGMYADISSSTPTCDAKVLSNNKVEINVDPISVSMGGLPVIQSCIYELEYYFSETSPGVPHWTGSKKIISNNINIIDANIPHGDDIVYDEDGKAYMVYRVRAHNGSYSSNYSDSADIQFTKNSLAQSLLDQGIGQSAAATLSTNDSFASQVASNMT